MLAADTDTPVVTKTTMSTNLLQALQIFTKLGVQSIGNVLRVFTILDILLSVEKPIWDLVLARVLHDGHDSFKFVVGEFTSTAINSFKILPLIEVDISLLQNKVGVTSTNTLDGH
jgi:hypothetical protein